MTPAIDLMLEKAVLLRRVVQEIAHMLVECSYKTEHAPPQLQPVYKSLLHVLKNDAQTTEGVAIELAEYFGQQTEELSALQRSEMSEFIEMCRQPLFVGLGPNATGYVTQITSNTLMRDC